MREIITGSASSFLPPKGNRTRDTQAAISSADLHDTVWRHTCRLCILRSVYVARHPSVCSPCL